MSLYSKGNVHNDFGRERQVMTESSETYPRSFIPAEAGCYVYPASRVTKCIRRQSPLAHPPSSARACASLSFDCFDGNRAEGSSTLESRPRFDLFHFLFSFKKKEEKCDAAQSKRHFFFSFCSRVFSFEPFSWYVIMRICVI